MSPARSPRALRTAAMLFAWAILAACGPSDGPAPVALDRTRCAHCGMLVSDLGFAAQVQSVDGEVFDFDDPGCLLAWRAEHPAEPRAVWYHHAREERWLRASEAAFLAVGESPMGFGIAAVDRGEPGSFEPAEAERRVRERAASGAQR